MPQYKTVKIRKESYQTAKNWAEKQNESIIDVISKAIKFYVNKQEDLHDKMVLIVKLLNEKIGSN